MHILLTTDTVGGVWNFTAALAEQLTENGCELTLLSLGRKLDEGQLRWVQSMYTHGVTLVETEFKLEWMEDCGEDILRSTNMIADVCAARSVDVLHTNQFAYGSLASLLPTVLTAHSDLLSWWKAVHGCIPPHTLRIRDYVRLVGEGLSQADRVSAPSTWIASQLYENYQIKREIEVIRNGLDQNSCSQRETKQLRVLSVGRAWDPGKAVDVLEQVRIKMPILIAGEVFAGADVPTAVNHSSCDAGVTYLGKQSADSLHKLYSQSAIYVATSIYEPFGLAPLEAALRGCALVLSDIESLREVWGDSALYYAPRDPKALETILAQLEQKPDTIPAYAQRARAHALEKYSAHGMAGQYLEMYRHVVKSQRSRTGCAIA